MLHASTRKLADTYLDTLIAEHHIGTHFITRLEPETKEFSIKLVRELIKSTIYSHSEPRLFVLYDFDSASIEAQNALLKTLEEHQAKDLFVMHVSQPYRLLPTIVSRSKLISLDMIAPTKTEPDTRIAKALESLTPPLNHPVFQVQQYENPLEPFDLLTGYLRTRYEHSNRVPQVLKEAVLARNRVRDNNLNAQYALDRLLIFIYKKD